jgi:fatty-acyl-CoA synthase
MYRYCGCWRPSRWGTCTSPSKTRCAWAQLALTPSNISSIEVEKALYSHPAVSLVAVVAMADEKWGEVPCAFVELSGEATEEELIAHAKTRLSGYQCPKKVIFGELPKTTTGKIRKNELRDLLRQTR